MTKEELIAFEADIAREFEAGRIHAPVHLSGGNEDALIDIFRAVQPQDWVFSTWRNHYHALLKGVPPGELKAAIREGRSMYFCSLKHKFICSSIVGGILPIALGVALGIKWRGLSEEAWCFLGDMAACAGIYKECYYYSVGKQLPIHWIVEDNGLSTNTPTSKVWGISNLPVQPVKDTYSPPWPELAYYRYDRKWPHVGVGKFIQFS